MNNSQKPQSGEILPCGFFVVFDLHEKASSQSWILHEKASSKRKLCMDVKINIMSQFPVIWHVHELK